MGNFYINTERGLILNVSSIKKVSTEFRPRFNKDDCESNPHTYNLIIELKGEDDCDKYIFIFKTENARSVEFGKICDLLEGAKSTLSSKCRNRKKRWYDYNIKSS